MTRISDVVTIFPIPKANFGTVALFHCDYLLVYLLDFVTILPLPEIVTISDKDCVSYSGKVYFLLVQKIVYNLRLASFSGVVIKISFLHVLSSVGVHMITSSSSPLVSLVPS